METRLHEMDRRTFIKTAAAGTLALAQTQVALGGGGALEAVRPQYRGPNVIVVRWGGGARRSESIEPASTYAPFLTHELIPRGILFPRMEIAQFEGLQTSHGEGTLNLLTGKYDRYQDIGVERPDAHHKFLGARFEAKVPTLFEYLRGAFDVADHQALLVNGEDRSDEEFYNFSNHHLFGVRYRSQTLSLRRYKTWLLRRNLAAGRWEGKELEKRRHEFEQLSALDYRVDKEAGQGPVIDGFWERWRSYYGENGLVNPRGDRLLTELSIRAIRELRPRLLMVNYQDCDYVHWGYMDHYTRAVAIMDEGMKSLVAAVDADLEYRGNTVFIVVPDCGRDNNPFVDVPCQHHFNSRSAHEIFALVFGTGVSRGRVVDRLTDQTSVAGTVGAFMGFKAGQADGGVLEEAFA